MISKLRSFISPCALSVVSLLVPGILVFTPISSALTFLPPFVSEWGSSFAPWYFIFVTLFALVCGFINLGTGEDDLRSVLLLRNFIKKANDKEALAPNLSTQERNQLFQLIDTLHTRSDVEEIYAGVLDDPSLLCSDRIFIYTAAPKKLLKQWAEPVRAEVGIINSRYQAKWFRSLKIKPGYRMWIMEWD